MPIRQFKTCGYCEKGLPLTADGEIDEQDTIEGPDGVGRLHIDCAFSFVPDGVDDGDLSDAEYDRFTDRYLGV